MSQRYKAGEKICLKSDANVKLNQQETILNPLAPELNPLAQRCLTRLLLGILLLEPCISLIYARKNKNATIIYSVY
jgi:hypothetical protein